MKVNPEQANGVLVLKPEGRIDGQNASDFQSSVMEAIADTEGAVRSGSRQYFLYQQRRPSRDPASREDDAPAECRVCPVLAVGADRRGFSDQRFRQDHRGARYSRRRDRGGGRLTRRAAAFAFQRGRPRSNGFPKGSQQGSQQGSPLVQVLRSRYQRVDSDTGTRNDTAH